MAVIRYILTPEVHQNEAKIVGRTGFPRKLMFSAVSVPSAFGTVNPMVLASFAFWCEDTNLPTPQYLLCQMHLGH